MNNASKPLTIKHVINDLIISDSCTVRYLLSMKESLLEDIQIILINLKLY